MNHDNNIAFEDLLEISIERLEKAVSTTEEAAYLIRRYEVGLHDFEERAHNYMDAIVGLGYKIEEAIEANRHGEDICDLLVDARKDLVDLGVNMGDDFESVLPGFTNKRYVAVDDLIN